MSFVLRCLPSKPKTTHNKKKTQDVIYTNVADVLISINPYKNIPLLYEVPLQQMQDEPGDEFEESDGEREVSRVDSMLFDSSGEVPMIVSDILWFLNLLPVRFHSIRFDWSRKHQCSCQEAVRFFLFYRLPSDFFCSLACTHREVCSSRVDSKSSRRNANVCAKQEIFLFFTDYLHLFWPIFRVI